MGRPRKRSRSGSCGLGFGPASGQDSCLRRADGGAPAGWPPDGRFSMNRLGLVSAGLCGVIISLCRARGRPQLRCGPRADGSPAARGSDEADFDSVVSFADWSEPVLR